MRPVLQLTPILILLLRVTVGIMLIVPLRQYAKLKMGDANPNVNDNSNACVNARPNVNIMGNGNIHVNDKIFTTLLLMPMVTIKLTFMLTNMLVATQYCKR